MGYGKAVSIHAPHEGERPFTGVQKTVDATVSIHAPHEGERLYFPTFFSTASKFQSTLPTRGSDLRGWRYMLLLVRFQSTLPTRGSDHEFLEQSDAEWVSIHAPHEGERRLSSLRVASYLSCFNPRSPRGGATLISGASSSQTMVSIHAPHEGERRGGAVIPPQRKRSFNPRSPRGGATLDPDWPGWDNVFQSTLPTRGSDKKVFGGGFLLSEFQSTLPTRGSDIG